MPDFCRAAEAGARLPIMRVMFVVYLLVIVAGVVGFTVIGLLGR